MATLITILFIVSTLVLAVAAKIELDLPKEQPTTFWALALGFLLFCTALIIFRSGKASQALEPKIQKSLIQVAFFSTPEWDIIPFKALSGLYRK